ncbi:DUF4097 family beta strand repeat-containing protein [Microbacterium sp. 13-71-7]|jgi:hypothetical protein|uniref:DUF4097 family beta strand repeat-containing protein n=1 Tax=Microbacterium sp. 13-71-7 TaxID=1970399 RepID=UPI000BD4C2FA|nr:DUF4097 family beta strand repeat-containing protein [Microbacterium sp. 13-71-7]OZB81361.1 MAG: hypothetical protein B7X32_17015 [Microbacterium sp. 13-71-7]
MTNLTPPSAPEHDPAGASAPHGPDPRAASPSPASSQGRGTLTAITIAAAIIGGGALVTVGGGSALAAVAQVAASDGSAARSTSVATTGVTGLKVEVGRGSATIRFDDVSEATMRVSGSGSSDWTMRRDGDVLRVDRPNGPFGWWIGAWFGADPQMTLTLPRELEGELTADLQLDAGTLSTEGRFDTLTTKVNAGSLSLDGGAKTVTTRVNAGSATLHLDDVTTADLSMSAGELNATIAGRQPDEISLDVSAGSMDVTVPTGSYALSRDSSAGTIEARIPTDPSSVHRIGARLSAGSITLREGS